MMAAFISLVCLFGKPVLSLDIGEVCTPHELRFFTVYPDDSILCYGYSNIWRWNANGELTSFIKMKQLQGKMKNITSCYYSKENNIFVVYDYISEAILFLDQHGKFLNAQTCSASATDPLAFFEIRQFIPLGHKIFALDVSDTRFNPSRPNLLIRLQLLKHGKTFQLQRMGQRFAEASEFQKRTSFNFKFHWIFQESSESRLKVVDQLSNQIRIFEQFRSSDGSKDWIETKQLPFLIRNQVRPLSGPLRTQKGTLERMNDWMRSFTRIVGFYNLKEGYLVAYNPQTKPNQAEVLGLQYLNKRGDAVGEPKLFKGRMVGMRNNMALILPESAEEKKTKTLYIDQIQIQAPQRKPSG